MRPIPADRLGHAHGLLRAIDKRGRLRTDEFVTEFNLDELFEPDLENALGRMRHFISYARAAGLVKEDRGVVELTEIGRRYIRAGEPDAPFSVGPQQAEWLRRQLREKHMTDSIFHGLAIGLSLLASTPPAVRISTLDFGRTMAYLGRAGWDNENTLQIQGERHLALLADMEMIDEVHRLTRTGDSIRGELTLPVHMSLPDLAAQLHPGGAEAVRAAAEAEWAEPEPPPPPVAEVAPEPEPEPDPEPEEPEDNGYHTVGAFGSVSPPTPQDTPTRPPVVPRAAAQPHPDEPPPPEAEPAPALPEPELWEPTPRPAAPESATPSALEDLLADAVLRESAPPPPDPAAEAARRPVSGDPLAPAAAPPAAATAPTGPEAVDPVDAPTMISPGALPLTAPPEPPAADVASAPEPVAPAESLSRPADPWPPAEAPAEDVAPPSVASSSPPEAPAVDVAPPSVAPPSPPAVDVAPPAVPASPPTADVAPPPPPTTPAPAVDTAPPPPHSAPARAAFLDPWAIRAAAEEAGLRLADGVYANVAAALGAGKHLLLTGAPGSGKTTLAIAVARAAAQAGHADGATIVTGAPATRLLTEAAARARWVIADELDQAEPDEALKPLSTLLGGVAVTLDGEEAEPAAGWRLVATWNGSPPRGASILRRFAAVDVARPPADELRALLAQPDPVAQEAVDTLLAVGAPVGAGVLVEAANHIRSRQAAAPVDATTLADEAIAAYVFPLLDR